MKMLFVRKPIFSLPQRDRQFSFFNKSIFFTIVTLLFSGFLTGQIMAKEPFTPKDLLNLKSVAEVAISPDGGQIAYTVKVTRAADDKPGHAYRELYLVSVKSGETRAFITGKVEVSKIAWRPDGSAISFLTKRNDDPTQVWMIPVNGGEAVKITDSETSVSEYRWHPSGKMLGFIAVTAADTHENALKDAGYGFIFYEENLKHRNLYLSDVSESGAGRNQRQLTHDISVWDFEFSPDQATIAASMSPKNLIDHKYAFRKIYLLDVKGSKPRLFVDNPGKLGNYAFSPDGKHLAYAAALTQKDNAVSQGYVVPLSGGEGVNLTPPNFRGHVEWVGWKDNSTLFYRAGEGVYPTLSEVKITGGERRVVLNSADGDVVFDKISISYDGVYWRIAVSSRRSFLHNAGSQKIAHDRFKTIEQCQPVAGRSHLWQAGAHSLYRTRWSGSGRLDDLSGGLPGRQKLSAHRVGARRPGIALLERLAQQLFPPGTSAGKQGVRRVLSELSGQHRLWRGFRRLGLQQSRRPGV